MKKKYKKLLIDIIQSLSYGQECYLHGLVGEYPSLIYLNEMVDRLHLGDMDIPFDVYFFHKNQ